MPREGRFAVGDGVELYSRTWDREMAAAHLILLHGYGEHCSRYDHVAGAFNEAGVAVQAYDLRGFGHSPGKRGYINDFDGLLLDLDAFLAHTEAERGDRPWFLLGHSLGGMMVAAYLQSRRVDARGIILSSPFLGFSDDVPAFLLPISGFLGAVLPWLPLQGVNNDLLARDPAVVAAANADPLAYHGKVHARTGAQFLRAINGIHAKAANLSHPMYILHGSDDGLVPVSGSQRFFEQCASTDKSLRIFEGGYHELWNDLCKEEAIHSMAAWVTERL